jgi:hypothetical protein
MGLTCHEKRLCQLKDVVQLLWKSVLVREGVMYEKVIIQFSFVRVLKRI